MLQDSPFPFHGMLLRSSSGRKAGEQVRTVATRANDSQPAFAHVFLGDHRPAIAAGQETDTNAKTNFPQYSDFGRGCFGSNGLAARAGVGWFHTDSASAADGYVSSSSAREYAETSTGKTA